MAKSSLEVGYGVLQGRSQPNETSLVLGIKGVQLPLPQQPTALTCMPNSGIHFVTTPESPLSLDCRIDQEFEL
jgi:hypothetical protein